ncbi:MAG: NADH:ubiquinone reductase (Na(+)-transporting) subunit B [Flavobacteriales bacterium]|nr:NADH:ubiquinone reductase (Na(+)-transporting) subunit B [Flavobacteriales bacterium]
MKLFKNILNSVKPHFEKGGKLEKLYPAYDAFETFLFVPDHTSHTGAHMRDAIDLKRTMFTVVLALIPALIFGMWNTGYQHFLALGITEPDCVESLIYGATKILPMIIVSYGVGLGIEFAFAISRGHSVNEGYLVTGLLIPMIMPADLPLWMLAVAVVFAVVIGKEVFGGTGMNILNPALTARAFLFFAYPTMMSGDKVWISLGGEQAVDGFSGATPLANAIEGGVNAIPSIMESFIGIIPGSIAETSGVAILIGAALLLISGIASWRVMIGMLLGGYAMGLIFNGFADSADNLYMAVPAIHQIVMGGFLFGMVFMATDPVSAAQTNKGKWIYGFLTGLLAILIRVVNPAYPEGVMMAILFMNVMAPLVDHYVVSANINRRMKRVKTA